MKFLVDTNILLRLSNGADPQFADARDAVDKLLLASHQIFTVPQCIYEFWVVATRPVNVNGLGLTAAQAQIELSAFRKSYFLLDETPAFFTEWEKLVALHSIIGKNAHDTRLVAAMVVHGITHLLTFNKQDFSVSRTSR